jgi:lysophospholipase L1-like esterase
MVRRAVLLLVSALVVVGLAACSSGDDGPAVQSESTTTTAKGPSLQKGDTYVALGSSIASGFGIAEQQTSCGRSTRDYPKLVAAKLSLKLVDVTCGAAVIPHVVDTKQGENPPQLDALTPDAELVTISVGGNDIAYNGTALFCGNPDTVCPGPADLDAKLAALPGALEAMVAKVRAKAPGATIVFVTYPREFPEQNCEALSLTDAELAVLQHMGSKLEETFVQVFGSSDDVVLVDPYVADGDHTGCAPQDQRWVGGYKVPTGEGFAFHPTALGHQVMADMVIDALKG